MSHISSNPFTLTPDKRTFFFGNLISAFETCSLRIKYFVSHFNVSVRCNKPISQVEIHWILSKVPWGNFLYFHSILFMHVVLFLFSLRVRVPTKANIKIILICDRNKWNIVLLQHAWYANWHIAGWNLWIK